MSEKVDILAIGAHPDDIELGCGGTLIKEIETGMKVGLLILLKVNLEQIKKKRRNYLKTRWAQFSEIIYF